MDIWGCNYPYSIRQQWMGRKHDGPRLSSKEIAKYLNSNRVYRMVHIVQRVIVWSLVAANWLGGNKWLRSRMIALLSIIKYAGTSTPTSLFITWTRMQTSERYSVKTHPYVMMSKCPCFSIHFSLHSSLDGITGYSFKNTNQSNSFELLSGYK